MAYSKVKTTVVERDGEELEWSEEISSTNDLLQALGIVAEDSVVISGGSLNPSVDGFPGIKGSVYFSSDGNIYKKNSNDPNDWTISSGGSGDPIYMKDIIDVDDNLLPEENHILNWDGNKWISKPICHPFVDYGLITQVVDCGTYDYGGL